MAANYFRTVPWFALAILFCLTSNVLAEKKLFTPKQGQDKLKQNVKVDSSLPNVLLIGDSISIGYTKPTIELLKDVANVQRARGNSRDTNFGRKSLKKWLGKTKWDVIHFNWGLHDLCYRHPKSKVQGRRDKVNGTIAVPLDEYEKNLELLVLQLKKTGAKLIWASTTPIPENEAGRIVGDDLRYNAAAKKIMIKHNVAINDLHKFVSYFTASHYTKPGNVHFTKDGSEKLAAKVASEIQTALKNNE